jgi:hypothetical protein
MGTDAAVPERGHLIKTHVYHADGQKTMNGWPRVRSELLDVLRNEGLLDRKTGSYSNVSYDFDGSHITFGLKVVSTKRVYCAVAPALLGEVEMKVYEVVNHRPTSI